MPVVATAEKASTTSGIPAGRRHDRTDPDTRRGPVRICPDARRALTVFKASNRPTGGRDAADAGGTTMSLDGRKRWLALLVLCFGDLMIVLDATIVNVALPSIRADLGFSETSLAWVVNAYLITFGGFLLLGGRLGEIFGHRRLFLIGLAVVALSVALLPRERGPASGASLDIAGAVTVTASLMLAVYAIVNGNETGWTSGETLALLGAAAALLALFLAIEARISFPLMPLGLFRNRNVSAANAVGVLMAAGMFAYFFFSALYLQQVLGYTPLEVGLAYLPSTVIWGTASFALSDKLVMRFGIKPPLVTGLSLMAIGILLFARAPVDGSFAVDVLPAMVLQGFGAGIGFNPILLAAMSDVKPSESGLASGVVNTSFMMGGALGLAVIASLAVSRTDALLASGDGQLAALTGGYHVGFLVGAVFTAAAVVLAAALLRGTS